MKLRTLPFLVLVMTSISQTQNWSVSGFVSPPPPRRQKVTSATVRIRWNPPGSTDKSTDCEKNVDECDRQNVDPVTGLFRFSQLRAGSYKLIGIHDSKQFLPGCKEIKVPPQQSQVEMTLQESVPYPYEGTLYNPKTKQLLANVKVRVVPLCYDWEDKTTGYVYTNQDGKFSLPDLRLAPGHPYQLQIAPPGLASELVGGSYRVEWGRQAGLPGLPRIQNVAFSYCGGLSQQASETSTAAPKVLEYSGVLGKRSTLPLLPPNDEIRPEVWEVDLDQGTVSPRGLSTMSKLRLHLQRLKHPSSIFLPAVVAGINQARDEPFEWRQGASGFGRRYASAYAYSIGVRNIFSFALDSTLHLDPRYFPSTRHGAWARLGDALSQTVVSRRDNGLPTFNFWRVGSAYATGFLSNAWYPDRISTPFRAALRGTTALGLDTSANLLREFSPELGRETARLFRRRQRGGTE